MNQRLKSFSGDLNYDQKYFLPHYVVVNENSAIIHLRVMFDGSCKTNTGISLNETLLKGLSI